MKIAHLADLHLGFRRYDILTSGGMNQREADVQLAVKHAIDDLLAVQPDIVLLAGDIFHSPRPSNAAILFLFQQLQRLRVALPNVFMVMVAGDHDTSRSRESGASILALYAALGVKIAIGLEPSRFPFPGGVVTAVPKWACGKIPPPEGGGLQLLVAHGEARKVGRLAPEIDVAKFAGYDYVALGHWHVAQQIAERAWYSGSLEFTSSDPWSEVRDHDGRKGYLLVEIEA